MLVLRGYSGRLGATGESSVTSSKKPDTGHNSAVSSLSPKQQELLRQLSEVGALKLVLADLSQNIKLAQQKPAGKA